MASIMSLMIIALILDQNRSMSAGFEIYVTSLGLSYSVENLFSINSLSDWSENVFSSSLASSTAALSIA